MTDKEIYQRVHEIYSECSRLVRDTLGFVPDTAGNIAIFCQSDEEYGTFKRVAEPLVLPSDNPAQKYFQLREPIEISKNGTVPATVLRWLYIRQPAADSPEAGDVDYVLSPSDYEALKNRVASGLVKNASIYERPNWDMIELKNKAYDALPYISTLAMAEKVRVRF